MSEGTAADPSGNISARLAPASKRSVSVSGRPVRITAGAFALGLLLATGALSGCPAECRYDTDCPDVFACIDGTCSEPQSLTLVQEGRCESNADCALGERCTDGRCTVTPPIGNGEEPGPECEVTRSADCSDGLLCRPSGELEVCEDPPCALTLECLPAVGRALPAWACTTDDDCSTGWCKERVCASACLEQAHCPNGFACQEIFDQPPWGSEEGRIRLCVPQDGTRVSCGANAYCPEEQACVWDYPDSANTYCDEPEGPRDAGEWCTWGQCQSGVCLSVNRCTTPCQETQDCPIGTVCGDVTFTGVPGEPDVLGCVPPPDACFKPTDCNMAENHQCRTRLVLGSDHPVFQCRGSSDAATAGDACTAGSDCLSGLCTPDGVCGHVCDDDTDCGCAYGPSCFTCEPEDDCALQDWYCGTMPYVVGDRTYTARVCRPG